MRKHSRGFSWPTKPPSGVLALSTGSDASPTVSFPFDEGGGILSGAAAANNFPMIRNLGSKPLGVVGSEDSASTAGIVYKPTRLGLALSLTAQSTKKAFFGDAGGNSVLKPTGNFSLEAWIQNVTWDNDVSVAGSWDGNGYMIYSTGGVCRSYINGTHADGATALPTGEVVHLFETYDGATVKLYVNGREDASTAASGLNASGVQWQGGTYNGGTSSGFWTDAQYVMVNLWNGRCLDAGEVRARYVNPFGIFAKPRLPFRLGKAVAAAGDTQEWRGCYPIRRIQSPSIMYRHADF